MGFRLPGEQNARMAGRIERSRAAQGEQERRQNAIVARRIACRKYEEDTRRWADRMVFDLYLAAGRIMDMLEEQRDRNMPKDPDGPWNAEFCAAVEAIPEARRLIETLSIEMIQGPGGGL